MTTFQNDYTFTTGHVSSFFIIKLNYGVGIVIPKISYIEMLGEVKCLLLCPGVVVLLPVLGRKGWVIR